MGILEETMKTLIGASLAVLASVCVAVPREPTLAEPLEEEVNSDREGKVLPVFQVVKFPNDVCSGTSRNGTCYTAEECSVKGGTTDGSCAAGFGVCCLFSLSWRKCQSEPNIFSSNFSYHIN